MINLVLPRVVVNSRSQRGYYAARAARAALEEAPAPALEPRQSAGILSGEMLAASVAGSTAERLLSIPLRYAAHVVTMFVVVMILLVSGVSSWAGVFQIDSVSVVSLAQEQPGDLVVQRTTSLARGGEEEALLVPAVRTPQFRFEPAFVENHTLAEGETLGAVAARYGISVSSLFWSNGLYQDDVLAIGQDLRIPRMSGIPHVIRRGETLDSIAERFGVQPAAIVLFKANGIREDRPLPVGREIFIPGGTFPYPDDVLARYGGEEGIAQIHAVPAAIVHEEDTNLRLGPSREYQRVGYLDAGRRLRLIARHGDWVKVDAGAIGTGWVRADLIGASDAMIAGLPETNDFPPLPPRWVWPARGVITSVFGWRSYPFRSFHDGLDIANDAGTKIVAARRGEVYEAGWCSGFGYCVKIDHGDGMTTIYGHLLKKPPVSGGDVVEAGDLIGLMGSTYDRSGGGFSTGVHLHFTVKVNGKAVDPRKFLP